MRLSLSATIVMLVLSGAMAQDSRIKSGRNRIGELAPVSGIADLLVTPNPRNIPVSLRELASMASLIIRASVTKVLPSRETEPRAFETDAVVKIASVLKGTLKDQEIVVSQRGGKNNSLTVVPVQYALLQPGEEYMLFLVENSQGTVSGLAQTKHYVPVGVWSGLFPFSEGRMLINAKAPDALRKTFEGQTVEQITSQVRNVLP